jgi:hypothetical protein
VWLKKGQAGYHIIVGGETAFYGATGDDIRGNRGIIAANENAGATSGGSTGQRTHTGKGLMPYPGAPHLVFTNCRKQFEKGTNE